MTASAFDGAGADEVAFAAKGAIGHTRCVFAEVWKLAGNLIDALSIEGCRSLGGFVKDAWQAVALEASPPSAKEGLDLHGI